MSVRQRRHPGHQLPVPGPRLRHEPELILLDPRCPAPATDEVNTPPEYDDAPGTVTDPTTPDTHGAGNEPTGPGADTDTVADCRRRSTHPDRSPSPTPSPDPAG